MGDVNLLNLFYVRNSEFILLTCQCASTNQKVFIFLIHIVCICFIRQTNVLIMHRDEIICLPKMSTVLPLKYINVGYRYDSKCVLSITIMYSDESFVTTPLPGGGRG